MAAFVIDASAGVEILTRTDRGKLLARRLEGDSELWIPELFMLRCWTSFEAKFLAVCSMKALQTRRSQTSGDGNSIAPHIDHL